MKGIFRADTRGVSEVVGAVLLLGILILLLSTYQVSVVPNQNSATEFDHNQMVEDEMVDVRNAILEARSSGEDTYSSVTLGTRYQDRTLTVNPPPPTGTLQTVEQRNISVTEGGGEMRADPLGLADRPLENQFIEYGPRYYEYGQAGTIRYENTVAYHDYGDATVLLTSQTLLRGDTVTLVPLEGEFRKNGIKRVAIEPRPGVLETVQVDDPNVTVPTELSEDEWRDLLGDELDPADSLTVSNGNLTLDLDGSYNVAYAPVGINRVPNEGERSGGAVEINPAAPGDIQLVGADWSGSTVELTFRNSADNTTFTNGRINFYTGTGNIPSEATDINVVGGTDNPRGSNWQISDDFADLDPDIELEGDGATTSVDFVFDEGVNENQDFFIVTLTLKSGQQATYFVGGSFSFDDGGGGGGSTGIAQSIDYNNDAGPYSGGSGVEFTVTNTNTSSAATIQSISVDTDDGAAAVLKERNGGSGAGQHDIFIGSDDNGWYEAGDGGNDVYTLGTQVSLTNDATINSGNDATFYLTFFHDGGSGGSGSQVDVQNDEITVTLYFSDGSQTTLTFDNGSF